MVHLVVTDSAQLGLVTAELHDWFYDLEDVAFEASRRQLVVPFRRWDYEQARVLERRRLSRLEELPWYRWYLSIGSVLSYEIDDAAQIGEADFNEVRFDEKSRTLLVEGGLPVRIIARVEQLHVQVEETDELLGFARRRVGPSGSDAYSGRVVPRSA